MPRILVLALVLVFSATTLAGWNAQQLEIGLGLHDFNYREEVPSPGKSTEKGLMKAVQLGFAAPVSPSLLLQTALQVAGTATHYDGSLQDGTPAQGTTQNLVIAPEITVATALVDEMTSDLVAYGGLSFRYWRRDLSGHPSGYLENYTMWTVPLGLRYRYFFSDNFSVGPDVSLRFMAGGNVAAYLGKFGLADIRLPLGERLGGRLALPVTLWNLFGEHKALVITPWYELLGIGEGKVEPAKTLAGEYLSDGDARLGFREPASHTHMLGVTTSVRFTL